VRERFTTELHRLEEQTLACLTRATDALDHALGALLSADRAGAGRSVAEIDQLERHVIDLESELLAFLALQQPVAGDLRLTAALLEVLGHAQRIAHQCMSIAKLVTLSGADPTVDEDCVACLRRMGAVARELVLHAQMGFAERRPGLAAELERRDDALDRHNRECFRIALRISADRSIREWAMSMMLAARALERVGDNAVDVARLAAAATATVTAA
jgi:phosphate transport system protein